MPNKRGRRSYRSYTNAVLIGLAFAILLTLQYLLLSPTHKSTLSTSLIPLSDSHAHGCHQSLLESDGWFCESDADWKIRKAIHRSQNGRNRVSDERGLFFQYNWEPTVHCAYERRIGRPGDGGKWICDVHRFKELVDSKLLVYSFGSNDDFSFEQALKKRLPTADIHTFDIGDYECPDDVCTYHRTRLGHGRDHVSQSLQMIMKELGHQGRDIQILKVDIEGSEFDLFEEMLGRSKRRQNYLPYIRQIVFEVHMSDPFDMEITSRVHRLFELFRVNNYAIFHKEPNLYDAQNAFEYSLIRLNAAFFKSD